MKVKICGITNKEDAIIAERYGADGVGFIFYQKSKRYIRPEEAKKIIASLSPFTVKVGVFVNEDPAEVNRIAADIKLNAVQLHGDESPEYIKCIEHPLIKSFRVSDDFDFSIIDKYAGIPILLDAFSQFEFGGTGKTFNWNLIPSELKSRIILAGGISVDNIDRIMNDLKPTAIDVSSSVEMVTNTGLLRKDEKKLKELFQKINLYRR